MIIISTDISIQATASQAETIIQSPSLSTICSLPNGRICCELETLAID